MKFKTATKPLLARETRLLSEREAASQAIFDAAAPRRDVPWQTCYRDYADAALRARYDAADRAVYRFHAEMAAARRGYLEHGRFSWYTP